MQPNGAVKLIYPETRPSNNGNNKTQAGVMNSYMIPLPPEEVKALQTLPMLAFVLRELWIRTQNERAWRRFYILPESTAEIEFNTAENYRNTHFREKDWENAPFRLDIPLPLLPSKLARKRDEIQ